MFTHTNQSRSRKVSRRNNRVGFPTPAAIFENYFVFFVKTISPLILCAVNFAKKVTPRPGKALRPPSSIFLVFNPPFEFRYEDDNSDPTGNAWLVLKWVLRAHLPPPLYRNVWKALSLCRRYVICCILRYYRIITEYTFTLLPSYRALSKSSNKTTLSCTNWSYKHYDQVVLPVSAGFWVVLAPPWVLAQISLNTESVTTAKAPSALRSVFYCLPWAMTPPIHQSFLRQVFPGEWTAVYSAPS